MCPSTVIAAGGQLHQQVLRLVPSQKLGNYQRCCDKMSAEICESESAFCIQLVISGFQSCNYTFLCEKRHIWPSFRMKLT